MSCRQSRLARPRRTREQQKPFPSTNVLGLKRAILPAAISDSAACRLLAEAESREQSRRRRRDQPSSVERDDHHEQNSAYSLPLSDVPMVPLAHSAERRSVAPEVTGSIPVRHPTTTRNAGRHLDDRRSLFLDQSATRASGGVDRPIETDGASTSRRPRRSSPPTPRRA